MKNLKFQALALFLLPAAMVLLGEAFARVPLIYSTLYYLPYISDLPAYSYRTGLAHADLAPLAATALGVGSFIISRNAYREVLIINGLDATATHYRAYLWTVGVRIGSVAMAALLVYMAATRYLGLNPTLSATFAFSMGFAAYRAVTEHGPFDPLAAGRRSAGEVERERRLRHGGG